MRLYPHQFDALCRMHNGCILCGGVGTGKSITSLSYYYMENGGSDAFICGDERIDDTEYLPMDDPPQDLYIITTARKRDSAEWDLELANFLLSQNPEVNLYGNKVVVDSWNNIKKYRDIKGAFFIFDEQRVVGSGAWVKAFLKITQNNKWILLSATPGDTWADYIPVFVANGFYKNKTQFVNDHIVYSRFSKFPKIERYLNTRRLERLRDNVLVTMEYKKMTTPHHVDIWATYDIPKYKDIFRTRWNPWTNEPFQTAAELCYGLRRVVNSDESRLALCQEIFEKRSRIIIFYNFSYELEILRNAYWSEDVEIAMWNGLKHQPVPECEKWVYLVQYNAGAEAWNCIKTDTIIFYSQNYSYRMMEQASGRIDRLNTPYKDLYYYHIKSRSGIDLGITRALDNKKKFNATAWIKKGRG